MSNSSVYIKQTGKHPQKVRLMLHLSAPIYLPTCIFMRDSRSSSSSEPGEQSRTTRQIRGLWLPQALKMLCFIHEMQGLMRYFQHLHRPLSICFINLPRTVCTETKTSIFPSPKLKTEVETERKRQLSFQNAESAMLTAGFHECPDAG